MKSITLNRILIILGVIGIFVAGALTYQHARELEIPCGADQGCNVVARHESSYLFKIPVAYLGLVGYIALLGLATIRAFTGKVKDLRLVGSGFFMSAFGMLFSLYLQYVSFFQIRATCKWCISSAITMIATFVVYVLLFNEAYKTDSSEEPKPLWADVKLGIIGFIVSAIAVPVVFLRADKINIKIEEVQLTDMSALIPEKRNQLGPDDAKVTVVEFADLCCPTCRNSFPKLEKMIQSYPKTLRVIYRHFPLYNLPGHEQSLLACVTSEVAADKGKFWQFAGAFTSTEEVPKTPDEVFSIAKSIGVSRADIEEVIDKETDAQQRVFRDQKDAMQRFNISGTPTYILVVPGKPLRKMDGKGLDQEMESSEVQALLKQ